MKPVFFFAIIMACVNATAQQAPGLAKPAPPAVPAPAPPAVVPQAPQLSNEELTRLLRAQTTAIKSLAGQLDSLEDRIGKLEKGQRP